MILVDLLSVLSFMLFAGGMAFAHLSLIRENRTTIEEIDSSFNGGHTHSAFASPDNCYDLGELYNLRNSGFGGIISWWFPTPQRDKYDGYVQHKIGVSREFFGKNPATKIFCIKDGYTVTIYDLSEVYLAASMAYQNQRLYYLGMFTDVPIFNAKDHEDTLKHLKIIS